MTQKNYRTQGVPCVLQWSVLRLTVCSLLMGISMMYDSKRDVANLLREEAEERSIRERLRQKQQHKTKQKQDKKKSRDSWER